MPQTFNCPTCGAPLEYDGGDDYTIRCIHCGNNVIVPEELRTRPGPATGASIDLSGLGLGDLLKQAGRFGEVARLARDGKKIEAIKLYRELTGVGLKEAKDAVDQLAEGKVLQVSQNIVQTNLAPGSPDLDEVARLAQAGQKIEAIKLYRELTGQGLKESKDAVEAMEAGQPVEAESRWDEPAPEPEVPPAVAAEIRNLVSAGNKIEAIKAYRQHFDTSLAEAKAAVEALEAGNPLPVPRSRPARPGQPPGAAPARTRGCVLPVVLLIGAVGLACGVLVLGGGNWFSGSMLQSVGLVSSPTPRPTAPLAPTLSLAQIDATSGAQARATRAAGETAAAKTQVILDETATVEARATDEAAAGVTATVEAQAKAEAIGATQAAWPPATVESFDRDRGRWPVAPRRDAFLAVDMAVRDGQYEWTVTPRQGNSYTNVFPDAGGPLGDFYAAVDLRFISGGADGDYAYGLVFRRVDNDYGFFGLQSDGRFRILIVYGTAIYQNYSFASDAIRPDEVNRLAVRALGPDFVFLINDQVVWQLTEADLTPGELGLGVDVVSQAGEAQVGFDNFEVRTP